MIPSVTGRWRIVEADLWDRDAIDLLGPAFFEIGTDGSGSFRFIAVEGEFDGRYVERDGHPGVEFSWVGADETDDVSGRGWVLLQTDDWLVGDVYLHRGDDSSFRTSARRTCEYPSGS